MVKKVPMSREGRARAARQQRQRARAAKIGITVATVLAVATWGYLLAGA